MHFQWESPLTPNSTLVLQFVKAVSLCLHFYAMAGVMEWTLTSFSAPDCQFVWLSRKCQTPLVDFCKASVVPEIMCKDLNYLCVSLETRMRYGNWNGLFFSLFIKNSCGFGTFPLVQNTPVFSFYFQSLENSFAPVFLPPPSLSSWFMLRACLGRFRSLGIWFPSREAPWRRSEDSLVRTRPGLSCDSGRHPMVCLPWLFSFGAEWDDGLALGKQPSGLRATVLSSHPALIWGEELPVDPSVNKDL